MTDNYIEITGNEQFQNILTSNTYVAVDFYATWCGPCKVIAPVYKQWAEKYQNIIFLKVDVDAHHEISKAYDVTAMPTFMFFKHKEMQSSIRGAATAKILEVLDQFQTEINESDQPII